MPYYHIVLLHYNFNTRSSVVALQLVTKEASNYALPHAQRFKKINSVNFRPSAFVRLSRGGSGLSHKFGGGSFLLVQLSDLESSESLHEPCSVVASRRVGESEHALCKFPIVFG